VSGALLTDIRVVNFRTARRLALQPGPICANRSAHGRISRGHPRMSFRSRWFAP
jgi:hypothetical protein